MWTDGCDSEAVALVQLQVPRPLPLLLLAVVLWTGQAENHLPL